MSNEILNNNDVDERVNRLLGAAVECYNRCLVLPVPTPESTLELASIHKEIESIREQATNHELNEIDNEIRATSNALLRAESAFERDTQAIAQKVNTSNKIIELRHKKAELEKMAEGFRVTWGNAEATPERMAVLSLAQDILRRVSNHEAGRLRGKELEARARIDFQSKTADFESAERYHKSHANFILVAMIVMAVAAALAVFWVLIKPPTDINNAMSLLERVILAGVGRIAIVFFFGWALSYLGSLHRSHVEQAVIYRDRRAALGVVENIIKAAELEQKSDFLQTMAKEFLNFEHNAFAFRERRGKRAYDDIETIKRAVEAVRPLLDIAKDAAGK